MASDDSASTVGLKPGVRGAGYCLFVNCYSEFCAVARWIHGLVSAHVAGALLSGRLASRRRRSGRRTPHTRPDAKGADQLLGRSETLKKFHSHVLPLSGEKA